MVFSINAKSPSISGRKVFILFEERTKAELNAAPHFRGESPQSQGDTALLSVHDPFAPTAVWADASRHFTKRPFPCGDVAVPER